jgi:hypothetical protein
MDNVRVDKDMLAVHGPGQGKQRRSELSPGRYSHLRDRIYCRLSDVGQEKTEKKNMKQKTKETYNTGYSLAVADATTNTFWVLSTP